MGLDLIFLLATFIAIALSIDYNTREGIDAPGDAPARAVCHERH